MLGGVVEGGGEGGELGGDGGDVDYGFGVEGGDGGFVGGGEEVREGELGGADGVREVDVEGGVTRGVPWVAGEGRGRGVPEGGECLGRRRCELGARFWGGREEGERRGREGDREGYGFVDPSPGTDDVCAAEFARCDGEHALQLVPFADVGLLEDGAGGGAGWGGVGGEEGVGFGAEGEVGEEDVAVVGEEGAGEVVVYALRVGRLMGEGRGASWWGVWVDWGGCVPEPAPVMMAVLPASETAIGLGDQGL